jgi:hypothetical protein
MSKDTGREARLKPAERQKKNACTPKLKLGAGQTQARSKRADESREPFDLHRTLWMKSMPKTTPSMAKNHMKKALLEILDPSPTDRVKNAIWEYFGNKCAYCGKLLERTSRKGHLDHAQCHAQAGCNGIYNRILACSTCNGDEKRDMDWESFLAAKCADSATRERRRKLIADWLSKGVPRATSDRSDEINKIVQDCLNSFDVAVESIRAIRDRQ